MLKFSKGRSEPDPAPDLNWQQLQQRALKNIRCILVLGLILILSDLVFSFTGQSVSIVSENGQLYLIRPAAGESAGHITLNAVVRSQYGTFERKYDIRLDPQEKRSDDSPAKEDVSGEQGAEDMIRGELRTIASGFNEDLSHRRIPLPMTLDSGEAISWRRLRSSNTLLLAAMTVFIILLIYRSRFRPLEKRTHKQQQSVLGQLPLFLNELVLLLNAGLVLSQAFERTVQQSVSGDDDTDYFRSNLRRIYHTVHQANGSLQEELRVFAKASGVSELMRVSNIISDNIGKGVELNTKLERESESLWLSRRLRAEERGRLAETKMTLPLSIFLCVLIIITVAPALLQL